METRDTKAASKPFWTIFHTVAMLSGIAVQLNWLAHTTSTAHLNRAMMLTQIIVGAAIFTALLGLLRAGLHWMLAHSILSPQLKERYPLYDGWAYTPFLLTYLGAMGLTFSWQIIVLIVFLFIAANVLLAFVLKQKTLAHAFGSKEWLGFLFLLSGVAALMYQIIWQRVLFTMYGVNIESVTIIVSIFMFGLGIGSILGGVVSERFAEKLPVLFLLCELIIGCFGVVSIPLIKYVGVHTQQFSLVDISLVTFGLLCIPTMMMGATLPILVTHINKQYHHVGKSVGILYFFNTIGSAFACFITVELFFVVMGLQATTVLAAFFNFCVGFLVYRYMTQSALVHDDKDDDEDEDEKAPVSFNLEPHALVQPGPTTKNMKAATPSPPPAERKDDKERQPSPKGNKKKRKKKR